MRRKARVEAKLEKLAVGDALRAIRFAEVVVLVVDAGQPFEKQDLQIADLIEKEGRAIVIALAKWDLVDRPPGDGAPTLPRRPTGCSRSSPASAWCRCRG